MNWTIKIIKTQTNKIVNIVALIKVEIEIVESLIEKMSISWIVIINTDYIVVNTSYIAIVIETSYIAIIVKTNYIAIVIETNYIAIAVETNYIAIVVVEKMML